MPTTTTPSRDGDTHPAHDPRPTHPVPPALHPVVFRRARRPYVHRQPHRWPLLLHAATASTCRRPRPVRPTATPVLPPSTLRGHASHTRAPCVSGATTAYPPAPALGRPPTAYRLSHARTPPTAHTSHTDVQGRATTHPKLPPHASHPPRSHPWGLAPLEASRHPTTRLAAPPRVSLPHHASRCPTTHNGAPLRVSSRHYACCHPPHHPCQPIHASG